ncbi:MAG: LuxR C-terminal-related transcriptional regulator, partial [Ignavibacteriaceae bacterium]
SKVKTIDCGGLTIYLPIVLPELGEQTAEADAETLKEAIISALFSLAKKPTAIFIDDIQWADDATIDMLTTLSDRIVSKSIIIVCTFISDEITRKHNVKKFRNELRRRRKLIELNVEPMNYEETKQLISSLLNGEPDNNLVEKIYNNTHGLPLFIEELVHSLIDEYLLKVGPDKISLADNANITIPENLKDAVLNQLNTLSPEARNKLEAASVAGFEFNPDLVIKLTGHELGFDELFERNLIKELEPGLFSFRHTIICEVIKEQVIWSRRRSLHSEIAEYLENINSHPDIIAEHWLSANEIENARKQFLISAERSIKIHAYSDAVRSAGSALRIWIEGIEEQERIKTLIMYAQCSQFSGDLNESVKALLEVTTSNYVTDNNQLGEVYRLLASVYALMGKMELSIEARLKAADNFMLEENLINSASELLIAAGKYTALLQLNLAYDAAIKSSEQAEAANRRDISTKAKALAGNILAMQGKFEEGKAIVQDSLSEAISNDLPDAASIIYRRLASTMEFASDYSSAQEAYYSAYNYCMNEGQEISAQICLGCMSYTLFQTGEWKKSLEISDEVINNKNTPEGSRLIGYGIKGIICALRGEIKKAIKYLNRSIEISLKQKIVSGELFGVWGQAIISEAEADVIKTARHYNTIIELWKKTQDKHDIILILIWAANFFSQNSFIRELTFCKEALASIASSTGNAEALTGLSFSLGEDAMMNNNISLALEHYNQALVHIAKLQMPLLQMRILYRLGTAHLNNGEKLNAGKHLLASQSISRNLGTRPFSSKVEALLIQTGIKPEEGRKNNSEERLAQAGLTRRQSEILELITEGLTNKEIADKLFLSTRTVDMHVSNILQRLNCNSRTEAIRKASALNLVR